MGWRPLNYRLWPLVAIWVAGQSPWRRPRYTPALPVTQSAAAAAAVQVTGLHHLRMHVFIFCSAGGMMMQPRYVPSAAQPHQSAVPPVAVGYQYYTHLYSQYSPLAVPPPPPSSWIHPAAAAGASPAVTIANHYVMPQQMPHLQPAAVCARTRI